MAIADAMRERQEGEQELAQVQTVLAEHRQRIGALKQDTEASLATAEKIEGAADAKERAFIEVRPTAPAPAPAHMARSLTGHARLVCTCLLSGGSRLERASPANAQLYGVEIDYVIEH